MAGKVAMRIDVSGLTNAIATVKPEMRFNAVLPPAPAGMPRFGWSGGFSWVIPEGCKHPEEAWKLVKYLASKRAFVIRTEAAQRLARGTGSIFIPEVSARRDITEWAMEEYLYKDPTVAPRFKESKRVIIENLPESRFRPVTPAGHLLWNQQRRATESALYREPGTGSVEGDARASLERGEAVVQADLDRLEWRERLPVLSWTPFVAGYAVLVVGGLAFAYWYFSRRMQASGYFRKEFYAGYAFAAPWFIGFGVLGLGPILFSIAMSLCSYDIFSPPRWVGLTHYVEMFGGDSVFYKSLYNTVYMVLSVPLSMAIGLAIAMLLNHEVKGMAVYRTFFYLPVIMPAVAASILWIWIFNPQQGVLNAGLRPILEGVGLDAPAWLQSRVWAKPAMILMMLWAAGGQMIIWLAGLKGIPSHLYEAAEIDGAGPARRFWNVTLPMLSPYILFNFVMGFIATFQIFVQAYVMTQGGPVDATLFYVYYIFNNAFRYMRMGYASALAWVLFAIIMVLTVVQLKLSKRWVHYESE
jgi:multiple sugar transport system permease protein